MKNCGEKICVIVWLVVLSLGLAGCAGRDDFYEEVKLSRDSAYQQWKSSKENQEQSQPRISGKLSVEDCLKLTIVNNKTLQRIVEEKEIARGEELKSYSAILPSVGISGNYTRKDEPMFFNIGGSKILLGDVDNYSAGLTVSQPIFAGGSIIARLNAGKLSVLMADQMVRAAVESVIYEAALGYYNVLLSQHLYEISADAVRSASAQLGDAKQKRRGGVASDFDVLRSEVELSNFQAELIKNKNAINVAKANLLKVMGVSQGSEFVPADELVYVPSHIAMEQAVEVAYKNRPDLFGRQFDIKLQKEMLDVARSRYWPSVHGFYDYLWSNPDPHDSMEVAWGRAWDAGITATLPIFDGFAREGEVIRQKARLKQAQINLVDAEETTLFELTRAIFSIEDAAEFVDSQALNLTRAKEGLRLAEAGYREGTRTQVETIDAQAALTRAKSNYFEAIYSHVVAKLLLQKAMGLLTTYGPLLEQLGGRAPLPKDANDPNSESNRRD